jgi:hypothetical protein
MLTSGLQVFLVGLSGGIVLEVLHWYNLRRDEHLPAYVKSVFYWVITIIMALIGGGLALLYFGSKGDGILTFHIGLSTPLILQKLSVSAAKVPGGRGGGPSLISFFSW